MGSTNAGVPPGFRFHPTEEELLHYYLKKKVLFQKFDLEVIREVDLNKMEPWELEERCRIGSTPQNEWYFFSHKDRKYPTGSRTNRATNAGFWKATGRDKCIRNGYEKIGMRKTLVFYRGRAPQGQKTDWIMHEYRLEENDDVQGNASEEGWVVCRVFKKKNILKLGNEVSTSVGREQQFNVSSTINSRTTLNIKDVVHYAPHRQQDNEISLQTFNLYKQPPEVALQHSLLPTPNFSDVQTHLQNHKAPLGYDFSTLPSDSPSMAKQLLTTGQMACENTYHQACDAGVVEVDDTCEPTHQHMVEGRRDHEWGILDRLVTTPHISQEESSKGTRFEDANASVHHINQLSLRGEMDLWGYGK